MPTFNPVLVIGLGGTGTSVARALRERLVWRYGGNRAIPFARFLFVDTDHRNPDAAGPDGILINPPPGQVAKMITHPEQFKSIGLTDWIDMETLKRADKGGFEQGAEGVRMFGRLAFLSAGSFSTMWNQISKKLNDIATVTDTQIIEALGLPENSDVRIGPPCCYVISSGCGGTGAGSFIDMGYVLHSIMEQSRTPAERVGIVAIARQDATGKLQYTRNSAAILSELDYYNRSGVVYKAQFQQQPPTVSRAAAYDYCYLVSPSGPKGAIEFDDLLKRISEYLYVDVIAQADEARSRRADVGPEMAEYDLDGYPLRFLTFGISTIEFPADVCHKACYHATIRDFIQTWLQVDSRGIDDAGATPLEASDKDTADLCRALGIGAVRADEDPLLTELTRVPEDLQDVAAGQLPQDWVNERIRRTFEGEITTETLTELETALNSSFAKDGYFSTCVEMNARRLKAARYLEQQLLETIVPLVFRRDRGPRYALGLLRKLQEKLGDAKTGELGRIAKEVGASQAGSYAIEDARQAIEAIRRDWLLRVPPGFGFTWINEMAVRREMQKPYIAICDTYNRRAEASILKAKMDLYAELLDPVLSMLQQRLSNLLRYLVLWHNEAAEDYSATMDRPFDRRTSMLFTHDVVQAKMDRVMLDINDGTRDRFYGTLLEPDLVANMRAALSASLDRDQTKPFSGGPPIDAGRGGKVQLMYVQSIADYIRERYRLRAAPGDPPVIYDERVIDRFQEAVVKRTGLAAEMEQVVAESIELAELDLGHPSYASIRPINPREGWWAFYDRAGDDSAWPAFRQQLLDCLNSAAGANGLTPPEGTRWRQEIEDSFMVVLLRERGAFPTRIIRGYDIAQRDEKINTGRGVGTDDMTAFARTGIRPQPPRERDIREAERFFLGAILLNIMELSVERQSFAVELAQSRGAARVFLELPTDFGVSVGELAYRESSRTRLGTMVHSKISEMGSERALEVLDGIRHSFHVSDTGDSITQEMAKRGIVALSDAQASNIIEGIELHFQLIPDDMGPTAEAHPYADYITSPPDNRPPGFYCRKGDCGCFLGSKRSAIPPQCPHCGSSYVPATF